MKSETERVTFILQRYGPFAVKITHVLLLQGHPTLNFQNLVVITKEK
jgi:hypothetical protein